MNIEFKQTDLCVLSVDDTDKNTEPRGKTPYTMCLVRRGNQLGKSLAGY